MVDFYPILSHVVLCTGLHIVRGALYAVLQVVMLLHWYSVKSQHEGLKGLNLMKVPMGQWGFFFLSVFLGQVQALAMLDSDGPNVKFAYIYILMPYV